MATSNAINANSAGLVKYNGSGTFSGVTVTNNAVLLGAASNGITSLALTDGQLAIGSTGADPVAASLTAGSGITITPGAGSITISASAAGFVWSVVTGTTQAAAAGNGYIANNAGTVTVTLPATSAVGDTISVTGMNNATGWVIAQNGGNQIFFGNSSTTAGAGGSLASSATRDTVTLICITTNALWQVISSIGNITIV